MKIYLQSTLCVVLSLFLNSCGISKLKNDLSEQSIDKNISINSVPYAESLGIANHIHTKINLGNDPKDIYVLLSNYASNKGNVSINKLKSMRQSLNVSHKSNDNFRNETSGKVHAPSYVEAFRKNIKKYVYDDNLGLKSASLKSKSYKMQKKEALDSEKTFYLDENGETSTLATLKKSIDVSTDFGVKTLNIWVSNDTFGGACIKSKCLNQTMIDALANIFLKEGSDNDVYDWVTNIYGEEWGEHTNNKLIHNTNKISILLSDLENDNRKTGGVVGFFFSKDNFKKEVFSGSNEEVMLYADSVVFANSDSSTWSIDGFWAKEMLSTLAHELQHMIHFYQKTVKKNADSTDTWLNEMLSESTEDLVASKIRHTGSRGVDYRIGTAGDKGNTKGRYPLFNSNNTRSLTIWTNNLVNYSVVNSFGAFLIRNYGGAQVLHDILYSKYTDQRAVEDAVHKTANGAGKTFNDLQREWGVAVLLSDNDNLDENLPRYNTGGYAPTSYNNSSYNLGSINFYNYNPKPTFHSKIGTVEAQGNYYYKVGTQLSGIIDIDMELSKKTEATIIVK